jgi:hypothetical protein
MLVRLDPQEVVDVDELLVLDEQCMSAKPGSMGEDSARGLVYIGDFNVGHDLVGFAPDIGGNTFRNGGRTWIIDMAICRGLTSRTRGGQHRFGAAIINGQHFVLLGFFKVQCDHFLYLVRIFIGKVVGLRPVYSHVIEFPFIVIKIAFIIKGIMQYGKHPAIFPDAAGAKQGVILHVPVGGTVRFGIKGIDHGLSG